jgi:5-methylcytosine-specific restriction protein A
MAHKTSRQLTVGKVYTRDDLRKLFDIQDATLNTGIFQPRDSDSIWLFITEQKQSDRTQYHDLLRGDALDWDSQPSGRKDDLIIEHGRRGLEILVFYRKEKYQHPHAGFRYEGPFRYVSHSGRRPAHFVLAREGAAVTVMFPDEVASPTGLIEGAVRRVSVNAYERNPVAREACLAHYGCRCVVCWFDFEANYGTLGKGFIHVHHLKQLSLLKGKYEVDPISDLRPVCPNCHAMLHTQEPPLGIVELQNIIQEHAPTS